MPSDALGSSDVGRGALIAQLGRWAARVLCCEARLALVCTSAQAAKCAIRHLGVAATTSTSIHACVPASISRAHPAKIYPAEYRCSSGASDAAAQQPAAPNAGLRSWFFEKVSGYSLASVSRSVRRIYAVFPAVTSVLAVGHGSPAFTRHEFVGRAFLRSCGHPSVVTRHFCRSGAGEIRVLALRAARLAERIVRRQMSFTSQSGWCIMADLSRYTPLIHCQYLRTGRKPSENVSCQSSWMHVMIFPGSRVET